MLKVADRNTEKTNTERAPNMESNFNRTKENNGAPANFRNCVGWG